MVNKVPIWVRTVAITLCIAMVYYFAGYRLVYSFVMHSAKAEASFAIQHNGTITKMILSDKEFASLSWTDKNKEFYINGQLFDLVSLTKCGNSYILQVYDDKNETRWAKAMNDFVKFLFPGDHGKKPVHAEGLLSAFQKEYTPLQKITVAYAPETTNSSYKPDSKICLSALLIKPIWHPPASC
jgi:hypothetical protein